jgi:hypothetical protein
MSVCVFTKETNEIQTNRHTQDSNMFDSVLLSINYENYMFYCSNRSLKCYKTFILPNIFPPFILEECLTIYEYTHPILICDVNYNGKKTRR